MKSDVWITITFILTCFFLAGCELVDFGDGRGLEPENGLEPGTFSVQVKGYVDRSFRGQAVFEILHGLAGEPYFVLMLQDIEEPGKKYRIIQFWHGPRPVIGRYDLANLARPDEVDPDKFTGRYDDSESYGSFKSEGGTLKISVASEEVLKGSFDFPAFELVPIGGGQFEKVEVSITGVFYAEEGDTGIILSSTLAILQTRKSGDIGKNGPIFFFACLGIWDRHAKTLSRYVLIV